MISNECKNHCETEKKTITKYWKRTATKKQTKTGKQMLIFLELLKEKDQ